MEAAMQKSTDKETLDNVATLYKQTGNTTKLQQLEAPAQRQQMLGKSKNAAHQPPCSLPSPPSLI